MSASGGFPSVSTGARPLVDEHDPAADLDPGDQRVARRASMTLGGNATRNRSGTCPGLGMVCSAMKVGAALAPFVSYRVTRSSASGGRANRSR